MSERISDIAKQFKELKDKSAAQAEALKSLNKEWDMCELELIDALIEEGVKSINIEGIGLIMMRVKNRLSVNIADKPVLFEYLKETKNEGILKLDINPATLGSWLDAHLEELIKEKVANGLDMVDAREQALKFLHEQAGVSCFSKREIALKKE
jgi:hypothetical protein